ncbi:MAG: Smr/MutS family protein [Cocleimonas sp.]
MANFDQKSLKALKKQLTEQTKAEKAVNQASVKKEKLQLEDENFFLNAMDGVNPLEFSNAVHEPVKAKSKPIQYDDFEDEFMVHDPLSDELEVTEVDGGEVLSFCRDGIQKNVFKKLRSGGYRISDELDLHGASVKQAKEILVYYLQEAAQFEGCCIRIIHGKGLSSGKQKSVLKTYINHWLTEHDRVLAFHSAKVKDGGTGAVYLLLKR